MLLSVITVCFNDRNGLEKTMNSLQFQSNQEFEWIVVDGGSTDGTLDLLKDPKFSNFKMISESDRGIYDAMNKGTALASGEYVYYLNAGDTLHESETLKKLLDTLEGTRPDLLYGRVLCVGKNEKYIKGREVSLSDFYFGMPICHQVALYNRAAISRNPYETSFRFISDFILTRNLFRQGKHVLYIDHVIAEFDLNGVSSNHHFGILAERFKFSLVKFDLKDQFFIFFYLYPKYALLWVLKKIGLHKIIRRIIKGY
jgi:glycosyltransferase involved in cell wall biosynthesis